MKRRFPAFPTCLALLCAACAASSPDHEPVARTRAALAVGQEVVFAGQGLIPAAQEGPRIVIPGEFPETDLAKVFCVPAGAAQLLQTLMPGPGVQPSGPRVAAGQGTIVVSTSPSGPVLGVLAVYAPSSSGWQLEASLAPPASITVADVFGASLATDGTSILADVLPSSGAPYLVAYDRTGSGWVQSQSLYSDPGNLGLARPASSNGVLVAASATPLADAGVAGNVYVFDRGKAGWVRTQKLWASDSQAGGFMAVATDSKTIVAGAPDADGALGAAYVFERDTSGTWHQTAKLTASDAAPGYDFGFAVGVDGDLIAVGAPGYSNYYKSGICWWGGGLVMCVPGKTYLFQRTASGWGAQSEVLPSNSHPADWFGTEVSLSAGVLVSESEEDLFAYSIGSACTTSSDCDGGTCSGGVCAQPAPCLPAVDAGTADSGYEASPDAADASTGDAGLDAAPDAFHVDASVPGADATPDGRVEQAAATSASGGCGCRIAQERGSPVSGAAWWLGAALGMITPLRRGSRRRGRA